MKKANTIISKHPKAPSKLWKFYKVKCGGNCALAARELGVNPSHVWKLLAKGIAPKRLDLREKLFLRVPHKRGKVIIPDYIQKWRHLPTEERRRVIQEYMTKKEA